MLKEPTQSTSPPKEAADGAQQRVEGRRAPPCGSWRRWLSGLLPFLPFTTAIALTLHYLTCKYGNTLGGEERKEERLDRKTESIEKRK